MNTYKISITIIALCFTIVNITAQNIVPDEKILFKEIQKDSLYLHLFKPEVSEKPTAVIVFFFGGGWTHGTPKHFYQQSKYLASRGVLAITAEYRVKNVHGTSPFDCVEDAKSAVRWVRKNAKKLHIDPEKIVASGGSAGGHIALCTALIEGLDNPSEDLEISSIPNAIIGFNPVLDTTKKGYGYKKVIGRETEISPCHQIKKDMPPMLLFHGNKDKTVPYENATRFTALMKKAENECKLITFDGVGHGFFNGSFFSKDKSDTYFKLTMCDTDVFLEDLGFIEDQPLIDKD